MEKKPIIEKIELKPGQERFYGGFPISASDFVNRRFGFDIKANCGCGGRMIPNKKVKDVMHPEWVCEKAVWWRFWRRKHARLACEVSVGKLPSTEPGESN